jgi:hypothetical protein
LAAPAREADRAGLFLHSDCGAYGGLHNAFGNVWRLDSFAQPATRTVINL